MAVRGGEAMRTVIVAVTAVVGWELWHLARELARAVECSEAAR